MKWLWIIFITIGILGIVGASIFFLPQKEEKSIFNEYDIIDGIIKPDSYIIDNNSVYINDENIFLSATPHTIKESKCFNIECSKRISELEVELISKQYSGDIDIVFGFNISQIKPQKALLYSPHYENKTESYTCDSEFNYTLSPKYFWCYNQSTNEIYFEHNFEYGNIQEKTAYWNDTYLEYYRDISETFDFIDYEYNDKNRWYYARGLDVNEGQNYILKIPIILDGDINTKYDIALKPSGETLFQAINNNHLYLLDPWVDSNGIDQELEHLTNGLRVYYNMNQSSAPVIDFAGTQNGTITGATTGATGIIEKAISFDGNDYINIGTSVDFTDAPMTISLWVNPDATLDYADAFIGGGSGSGVGCWAFYHDNEGDIVFGKRGDPDEMRTENSSYRLKTGTWQMVSLVYYASNQIVFYFNGTMIHNVSYTDTFDCSEDYVIGAGSGEGFEGDIDEVSVWNRTLNGSEILELYNSHGALTYTGADYTGTDSCSCPSSANWEIDLTDNCDIQDNCDITGYNISFINTGTITFNASITSCDIGDLPDNQRGYLGNNAKIYIGECS